MAAKNLERVEMIRSSVLQQVEIDSQKLISTADQFRETELERFQEDATYSLFHEVQGDATRIRQNAKKEISVLQVSAWQSLLHYRQELTAKVFDTVSQRLKEYSKTSVYEETLLQEISTLCASYEHTSTTVFLPSHQMHLKDSISTLLNGAVIEEDTSILLGGWKFLNRKKRALIDGTLDAILEKEKNWFYQNSHLDVIE